MTKIKIVQYGCGPIGCSVARFASQRPDIEIVGAIDIDKGLVGRDLGEVANLARAEFRVDDRRGGMLSLPKLEDLPCRGVFKRIRASRH